MTAIRSLYIKKTFVFCNHVQAATQPALCNHTEFGE